MAAETKNKSNISRREDIIKADDGKIWDTTKLKVANIHIDWNDTEDPEYRVKGADGWENINDRYITDINYGSEAWKNQIFGHTRNFGKLALGDCIKNVRSWHADVINKKKVTRPDWVHYINLRITFEKDEEGRTTQILCEEVKMYASGGPYGEVLVDLLNKSIPSNGYYPGFPLKKEVSIYLYLFIKLCEIACKYCQFTYIYIYLGGHCSNFN